MKPRLPGSLVRLSLALLAVALLLPNSLPAVRAQNTLQPVAFLPLVVKSAAPPAPARTVNAPHFSDPYIEQNHFSQMAIFWFGRVLPSDTYTDVRVGYSDSGLVLRSATLDRLLWYNKVSNGSDLEQWDSIALALQTDGGMGLSSGSYRFVAELRQWETTAPGNNWQAAYQGNGGAWVKKAIPFTAIYSWRGDGIDNTTGLEAQGWGMTFTIPFSSLGLSGPPAPGTLWRMHFTVYNRDSLAGPPLTPQVWPESSDLNTPAKWGGLRFGLPAYAAPASKNPASLTVRNHLNGQLVPDADVGGGSTCGGTGNYFNFWGQLNYNAATSVNIQNESDYSNFPCFSKYYVTFPLSSIPPGKLLRSATLYLSQFGGSNPPNAHSSGIWAFAVGEDWNEPTINWNNAPLALENLSWTQVNVYTIGGPNDWPTIPRYAWDVSAAANQALQSGQPLRLALYSADQYSDSGKYFVSSEGGDWNYRNLPAVELQYVDP